MMCRGDRETDRISSLALLFLRRQAAPRTRAGRLELESQLLARWKRRLVCDLPSVAVSAGLAWAGSRREPIWLPHVARDVIVVVAVRATFLSSGQ